MNTAARIAPQITRSRRVPTLAAASGLVAAAAVAITLAVSGGGVDEVSTPSPKPSTASPSIASPPLDPDRAAERFHHFR